MLSLILFSRGRGSEGKTKEVPGNSLWVFLIERTSEKEKENFTCSHFSRHYGKHGKLHFFFLFFFPKPFSFLEIHRSKEACVFFPQAALKRKEMFFFCFK